MSRFLYARIQSLSGLCICHIFLRSYCEIRLCSHVPYHLLCSHLSQKSRLPGISNLISDPSEENPRMCSLRHARPMASSSSAQCTFIGATCERHLDSEGNSAKASQRKHCGDILWSPGEFYSSLRTATRENCGPQNSTTLRGCDFHVNLRDRASSLPNATCHEYWCIIVVALPLLPTISHRWDRLMACSL